MIRNPRLAPLVGAGIALITAGTVFLAGALSFSPGGVGNDILRAVGPEGSDGRSLVLPLDPSSDGPSTTDAESSAAGAAAGGGTFAAGTTQVATAPEGDTATAEGVAAAAADGLDFDSSTARSLQPTSGRLAMRGARDGGGATDADEAEEERGAATMARGTAGSGQSDGAGNDKGKGSRKGKGHKKGSRGHGKGRSNSAGHSAPPSTPAKPAGNPKPASNPKPAKASNSNKPSHTGPPAHSNAGGKGKGRGKG